MKRKTMIFFLILKDDMDGRSTPNSNSKVIKNCQLIILFLLLMFLFNNKTDLTYKMRSALSDLYFSIVAFLPLITSFPAKLA